MIDKGADISECGKYRYRLWRIWDIEKPLACFVMLNPSTADGEEDDPTVRRCMGFAKRLNCGGLVVVNLFAYRATNPKELHAINHTPTKVGPENDTWIKSECSSCDLVIVAWGSHGGRYERRYLRVLDLIDKPVYCLGRTRAGDPRHPLYLRADSKLELWAGFDT